MRAFVSFFLRAFLLIGAQLSVCVERFDPVQRKWANHPGSKHVEALWYSLPLEQRLSVWDALGRQDHEAPLEVLELGHSRDNVDDEEMRKVVMQAVLPERLDSVRVLFLAYMWKLTDASIQTLAPGVWFECGC